MDRHEFLEGRPRVIFLHYDEGQSVRGVARALSISTSAKPRLQKGRDLLRESPVHAAFFEEVVVAEVPLAREILLAPASSIGVDLLG